MTSHVTREKADAGRLLLAVYDWVDQPHEHCRLWQRSGASLASARGDGDHRRHDCNGIFKIVACTLE